MVCVYCGSPTQVVNSRHQRRTNDIWRRRRCTQCRAIFTTTETTGLDMALRVALPNARLVPFQRDVLFISLYESCKHRPSAAYDASNLTRQVTNRLLANQEQPGLITRAQIISVCRRVLEPFDAAAATMYAAYHKL